MGFPNRTWAIWLGFSSVLSMLLRSYYDIRYIHVEEFSGLMPGMDMFWFLGFMLVVGGHMAALVAAA